MPLRLNLLGTPLLAAGTSVQILPFNKPTSLLFYLALRGSWASRSELAFLFRPDETEEQALAYLRKLVFRARRLDWGVELELTNAQLRWPIRTDVADFKEAIQRADWGSALNLYRGPLLAGLSLPGAPGYDAWLELEREQLCAAWRRASLNHAGQLERRADFAAAATVLEDVLASDPLDEDVVQTYLRVLKAGGDRRKALGAFESFRRTIVDELGVEPLESTQALADSVRQQHSSAGSAAPVDSEPLAATTSFVGRTEELARVEGLLADRTRLVTIVGLGGTGKSRLAREVERRLRSKEATLGFDGAVFVPLSEAQHSKPLKPALLAALGLFASGQDPGEALAHYLRDRRILLILDSAEHIQDDRAFLAELLAKTRQPQILATSREPLSLAGERRIALDGLRYPARGESENPESFDAVRLFVGCAARVAPGFTATEQNLRAIAQICAQVEGMPLAIELAAGWTRVMTPHVVARELARDFDLLSATEAAAPERHYSVRRIFDYTWERLTAPERSTLARLSVFKGGFSFEASEAVAGATLPILLNLMNRALLRRIGENRFGLHELVRQYAGSKQDIGDAREAHARYYARFVRDLTPDVRGADQLRALGDLHLEIDNILQMWAHAVHCADLHLIDLSLVGLDYYFHLKALFPVAAQAFEQAEGAVERRMEVSLARRTRARLLTALANYRRNLGSVGSARELAAAAEALARSDGDAHDVARALLETAKICEVDGDYERSRTLLGEVLKTAEGLGDMELKGAACAGLGNLLSYTSGNQLEALYFARESHRAYRQQGDLEGVNTALINMGACYFDLHDFRNAERCWREASEIAGQLGHRRRQAVVLNNLGSLFETSGANDEARRHYTESLSLRLELGDRRGVASALSNLGGLAHAEGRHEEAAERLGEALGIYEELQDRANVAYVKSAYARALIETGELAGRDEQDMQPASRAWDRMQRRRHRAVTCDMR